MDIASLYFQKPSQDKFLDGLFTLYKDFLFPFWTALTYNEKRQVSQCEYLLKNI